MSVNEKVPGGVGGEYESDPDASATVAILIAGAILLVVVVVALQGLYGQASQTELRRKIETEKAVEIESLRARQLEQLSSYRWVDAKEGLVAIPIDRAMELVVERRRTPGTP